MNTYKELKARDAKKRKEEEIEIFKLTERHRMLIYPNGVGKDDIPYQLKLLRLINEAYGVDENQAGELTVKEVKQFNGELPWRNRHDD